MGIEPDAETGKVGRLTAIDLRSYLSSGSPVTLLDVREPFERAYCVIAVPPTTVQDLFIPMGQIPERFDEIRETSDESPLVVYCHHGVRSMAVARWLAARGCATVYNLEGGIDAWSIEADPTVPRY
jgi:rhodanese-related sulfurtransferase